MPKVCKSLFVAALILAASTFVSAQTQTQPTASELNARIQELQKQLSDLTALTQVAAAPQQGRGQAPAPAQGGRGAQAPAAPAPDLSSSRPK